MLWVPHIIIHMDILVGPKHFLHAHILSPPMDILANRMLAIRMAWMIFTIYQEFVCIRSSPTKAISNLIFERLVYFQNIK